MVDFRCRIKELNKEAQRRAVEDYLNEPYTMMHIEEEVAFWLGLDHNFSPVDEMQDDGLIMDIMNILQVKDIEEAKNLFRVKVGNYENLILDYTDKEEAFLYFLDYYNDEWADFLRKLNEDEQLFYITENTLCLNINLPSIIEEMIEDLIDTFKELTKEASWAIENYYKNEIDERTSDESIVEHLEDCLYSFDLDGRNAEPWDEEMEIKNHKLHQKALDEKLKEQNLLTVYKMNSKKIKVYTIDSNHFKYVGIEGDDVLVLDKIDKVELLKMLNNELVKPYQITNKKGVE